jgi:hypothetical protein
MSCDEHPRGPGARGGAGSSEYLAPVLADKVTGRHRVRYRRTGHLVTDSADGNLPDAAEQASRLNAATRDARRHYMPLTAPRLDDWVAAWLPAMNSGLDVTRAHGGGRYEGSNTAPRNRCPGMGQRSARFGTVQSTLLLPICSHPIRPGDAAAGSPGPLFRHSAGRPAPR